MSKKELFDQLKAAGRIPKDIKSPGQRKFKQAPWFYQVYKQGYYWVKPDTCTADDLPAALKLCLSILAADVKARYLKQNGSQANGRRYVEIDVRKISDTALLYLLKKLGVIPQTIDSLRFNNLPPNIYLKFWKIKNRGYFRYGWEKRDVQIDVGSFIDNLAYVDRIIKVSLRAFNLCDYHEAYSTLYFRAYELSGHPLFLNNKWLYTVMRFEAMRAKEKERNYYKRMLSYDEILEKTVDGDEGMFDITALQQKARQNYIQLN